MTFVNRLLQLNQLTKLEREKQLLLARATRQDAGQIGGVQARVMGVEFETIESHPAHCWVSCMEGGFDETILSLYARWMSARDAQSFLREKYDDKVSPEFIS